MYKSIHMCYSIGIFLGAKKESLAKGQGEERLEAEGARTGGQRGLGFREKEPRG